MADETAPDTAASSGATSHMLDCQDWRARLVNVERLLVEGMDDAGTSSLPYHRMRDALAEVRSLLGGE